MYIGIGGQSSGTGATSKPRSRFARSSPGSVASSALPRRKGAMPAKPGTVTAKRRRRPRSSAIQRSMSSARRGS